MKYFKYLFAFVVLSFTSCQKDIDINDQTISPNTEIDQSFEKLNSNTRDSTSTTPCLIVTQNGYDENGCCIYIVTLPRGVAYYGRSFFINATNGAIVNTVIGQGTNTWEVIICDSTILTLISQSNETSYIECSMTLDCPPEENCCDAFCLNASLSEELDENGCFQVELTIEPRECIGIYFFDLDDNIELLYENIEVATSQKSIKIDLCNIFGVYDLEDFVLEATLYSQNCGEIQIGPVAIFNGETDPVICNPGNSI